MILRTDYIKAIDASLVKILSGVRRCGKSTILEMIQAELINRGISEEKIISKKYTEMGIDENYTSKEMYSKKPVLWQLRHFRLSTTISM